VVGLNSAEIYNCEFLRNVEHIKINDVNLLVRPIPKISAFLIRNLCSGR